MTERRTLLKSALALGAAASLQPWLPAWARSVTPSLGGLPLLQDNRLDLYVAEHQGLVNGRPGRQVLVNGELPAPLLRWREGQELSLRVHNALSREDTSIHWHGLLLPFQMDGVPGLSFPGIAPGESFEYRFPLLQAGTYWYHSHSGFQEQIGLYGPIIIDPIEERIAYDREYVILLSDWSHASPERIFSRLKTQGHSFNFQQRTFSDFLRDVERDGWRPTWQERLAWGRMRMARTDIADVTGATYTYLMNGHSREENWQGIFEPGERVRLRFINASAMSIFNIRIPGVAMTVVQADGMNVSPVEVDEFQIGTAETFDVVVQPSAGAWTVMCEANDRSDYVRGTLTSAPGLDAEVPALRSRPLLTMKDMGMGEGEHAHHHHGASEALHPHPMGPGVITMADQPVDRLHERPLGLEDEPHRVLVYSDLLRETPAHTLPAPDRELELHLTSNMERYMWAFDGVNFAHVDAPLLFHKGERVRMTLVNDTMMPHPIHLHGMFFELVTGAGNHQPLKHTVVVKPGEKMAIEFTADAEGDWAFHCHLLYHMMAGMMHVVSVRDPEAMS